MLLLVLFLKLSELLELKATWWLFKIVLFLFKVSQSLVCYMLHQFFRKHFFWRFVIFAVNYVYLCSLIKLIPFCRYKFLLLFRRFNNYLVLEDLKITKAQLINIFFWKVQRRITLVEIFEFSGLQRYSIHVNRKIFQPRLVGTNKAICQSWKLILYKLLCFSLHLYVRVMIEGSIRAVKFFTRGKIWGVLNVLLLTHASWCRFHRSIVI